MGAVAQTFFLRKVLMMDDLPVLGYPMKPTEICLRLACRAENWRSREIRVPLPKECVRLAWKARVGWSRERILTHFACEEESAYYPCSHCYYFFQACKHSVCKIVVICARRNVCLITKLSLMTMNKGSLLKTGHNSPSGSHTKTAEGQKLKAERFILPRS